MIIFHCWHVKAHKIIVHRDYIYVNTCMHITINHVT